MPFATEMDSVREFARNVGRDEPERAWILTPQDVWMPNPFYHGPKQPHPEDDDSIDYGPDDVSHAVTVSADLEIPY